MFNVGGPEIMVIILVALLVLGPEQLPKAMRTFGSVMGEIRKVSNGFQAEVRNVMDGLDPTKVDLSKDDTPSGHRQGPGADDPTTGVIEVSARNDGPPADAGQTTVDLTKADDPAPPDRATDGPAPAEPSPVEPTDRPSPAIDPADRAAG